MTDTATAAAAPAAPAAGDSTAKPAAAAAPANDGGAPPATAAADPAAKSAAGGEPAADHAGVPYKPEGLPEHLLGKTDKETIENINKAYKGAREELGKKGNKAPETPDAYTLTLPDDLKGKVISLDASGKDPVFEALKPALHKAGLSNESASMLTTELYKAVSAIAAKNADAAANDPAAADVGYKQLGGPEKAKPLLDSSNAWILAQKEKLGLDDADVQELQYLTMHSQGLKVLNKLRGLTSEKPIPADFSHGQPDRQITAATIESMQADQRYIDGDPEFHKEVRDAVAKKQAQEKAKKS